MKNISHPMFILLLLLIVPPTICGEGPIETNIPKIAKLRMDEFQLVSPSDAASILQQIIKWETIVLTPEFREGHLNDAQLKYGNFSGVSLAVREFNTYRIAHSASMLIFQFDVAGSDSFNDAQILAHVGIAIPPIVGQIDMGIMSQIFIDSHTVRLSKPRIPFPNHRGPKQSMVIAQTNNKIMVFFAKAEGGQSLIAINADEFSSWFIPDPPVVESESKLRH